MTARQAAARIDLPMLVMGVTTLLVVLSGLVPATRIRLLAAPLDLALDSVALVIAVTVAALSWVQYRDRQDALALHQSAAFLVLAFGAIQALAVSLGPNPASPLAIGEPDHTELVALTQVRGIAAALLLIGGICALRRRWAGPPLAVLLLPLVPAAGAFAAAATWGDRLPPATVIGADGTPVSTPFGIALQVGVAALFAGAALTCWRVWIRDRRIGDRYLAAGLVLMTGAHLSDALAPNTHPGPVAGGDLLRIAFGLVLLLAIQAQARALLAALRRSAQTALQLKESEVARATLEERARLSRELHDGLTQDLWLAKMKLSQIRELAIDPAAATAVAELTETLDRGLEEARQVVLSLRLSVDDGGFESLLTQAVDEAGSRFGLRATLAMEAPPPRLPARTQAELIRIVREALTNAHRHAGASRVRVTTAMDDDRYRVVIEDDGNGFDREDVPAEAIGLRSMSERATGIDADLAIDSGTGRGTRVQVVLRLDPAVGGR